MREGCLHCGRLFAHGFGAGGEPRWCDETCFIAWDRIAEAEEALGMIEPIVDPWPAPRIVTARPMAEGLIGRTFGQLTVIRREWVDHGHARGRRAWVCRCSCGGITYARTTKLTRKGLSCCSACAQAARQVSRKKPIGGVDRKVLAERLGITVKGMEDRIRRGVPVTEILAEAGFGRRAAA